jgi:hypothetical protein
MLLRRKRMTNMTKTEIKNDILTDAELDGVVGGLNPQPLPPPARRRRRKASCIRSRPVPSTASSLRASPSSEFRNFPLHDPRHDLVAPGIIGF